ncbi:MAG: FmdB family zinc ribbon protein [Chloroflexota bacterium]|nr:FmdB family zinc ribbon protein [Chloroflexota bacterium]
MPIYEYYCVKCRGRFRQLARTFNAPPPACPRCGSQQVEKLVSLVNAGQSAAQRRTQFDQRAQELAHASPQEMARGLQAGGSLTAEVAPFGMNGEAFQEIVKRRAQGATDAELEDISEALPFPAPPEGVDTEHESHSGATCTGHHHSRRDAPDLGWG